jgi:DNA polymerase III subunit epsilon
MFLFFDTETTGLPLNWKAPISDSKNWPRLVQIAWILFDCEGNRISAKDHIIKPEGFTIPKEASRIHGITNDIAINKGIDLKEVLYLFNKEIDIANILVGHNISFDLKVVLAEMFRRNIKSDIDKIHKICTMEASTDFCKLPGNYGYKWPKLSELHFKLFGSDFEEAHNASVDIEITAKCFWRLKELKILI